MSTFLDDWLIHKWGFNPETIQLPKMLFLLAVTLVIAFVFWRIGQIVINNTLIKYVQKKSYEWDKMLKEQRAFRKLGHLIPVLIITLALPIIFNDYPKLEPIINTITSAIILIIIIRVLMAIIDATNIHLSTSEKYRDKPIASFTQLAKILVVLAGIVFIISVFIQRNPIAVFGAMGAISAVLLLIFKDTLLGFIASIQLTVNDMVRIGDWVSVPKYGADGDVIGIYLTTVKVSNWDKTISTVPTYSFVSDSFKNWRGMRESGGRRIKRAINIKISTVKFCDEEMLERFSKIQLVKDYIASRQKEIAQYNLEKNIDTEGSLINGRRMTNIGVFRIYIYNYIINNPNINLNMTHIVRQLDPTANGVPLEIYCFSANQAWVAYEGIQSDLFDHVMAAARHFDLEIFENPASSDLQRLSNAKLAP